LVFTSIIKTWWSQLGRWHWSRNI